MKNTKYTEAELIEMKLHRIEGLVKAKKENKEITKKLSDSVDHKSILTDKFNFSPVQADCILDLKIPLSELDEQLFINSINDLGEGSSPLLTLALNRSPSFPPQHHIFRQI